MKMKGMVLLLPQADSKILKIGEHPVHYSLFGIALTFRLSQLPVGLCLLLCT